MDEAELELWKLKHLVKSLNKLDGSGTSMVTLIIPPSSNIPQNAKLLSDELGTASNIKSRVNRLSVESSIVSAQQKLKLYNSVPKNGLAVFCGTDNFGKKISIAFEPCKALTTKLYMCDSKFHTESLESMLVSDDKFGFIIIDGNSTLYATVSGNVKEELFAYRDVNLPKKHNKGGQSALRFARHRTEAIHNYLRKISEKASDVFITNNLLNVKAIVIAGSANLKTDLSKSDLFDPRIKAGIVKMIDIQYGLSQGLDIAIKLSEDVLGNIKYTQECAIVNSFMNEITLDTGKYIFGVKETIEQLKDGTIETLIINDTIEFETKAYISTFAEGEEQLSDWFLNNYKLYGAKLSIVSANTDVGAQFLAGFGGVGGILRYRVHMQEDDIDSLKDIDLEDLGL